MLCQQHSQHGVRSGIISGKTSINFYFLSDFDDFYRNVYLQKFLIFIFKISAKKGSCNLSSSWMTDVVQGAALF